MTQNEFRNVFLCKYLS